MSPLRRVAAACLLILLAAAVPLAAADPTGATPCYYKSHFVIGSAGADAACKDACAKLLASRGGKGSIYPETYVLPKNKGGQTCCKCQYHATPFVGDPSPGSANDADPASDDAPTPTPATAAKPAAAAAKAAAARAAAAKKKKKTTFQRVWWKVAIAVGALAIILLITAAMLWKDCCGCRRNRVKVSDLREAAAADRKKRKGKHDSLSTDARRRLAALDLARDLREMKLEAAQPAHWVPADAGDADAECQCQEAVAAEPQVVVAAATASAPSSPAARQRRQRGFTTLPRQG